MLDEEGAKEVYRAVFHREPENDQVWRPLVGQKASDVLKKARASDEFHQLDDKITRFDGISAQLEQLKKQGTSAATPLQVAGGVLVDALKSVLK